MPSCIFFSKKSPFNTMKNSLITIEINKTRLVLKESTFHLQMHKKVLPLCENEQS